MAASAASSPQRATSSRAPSMPRPVVHATAGAVATAAPVVATASRQALDATTGIPSMIGDAQTLADPHKSLADKLLAGGDLVLNVAMDASMVVGVGEAACGAYIAAKVATKVGEEGAERAADDLTTHAGQDAAL